jgi:hypothetical protein
MLRAKRVEMSARATKTGSEQFDELTGCAGNILFLVKHSLAHAKTEGTDAQTATAQG